MPDEFPTLDAVAALATLAASVRTVQLFVALAGLRKLEAEIVSALRAGDREHARRLASESEAMPFSRVVNAVLEASRKGSVDREALERTVEHSARRLQKRSRRASASGVLVGLLLIGMLFYSVVSRLSPSARSAPSTLFDALVVLGVLMLADGILLNQRLATETRRAALRVLGAITDGAGEQAR